MHEVAAKFERIGWGVAKNPDHDLGTDLYLAPRDDRLVDLAMIAGAQVKAGPAYFREAKRDGSGVTTGWWYRESHRRHFDYWVGHHAPHLLVLHDVVSHTSYWAEVSRDTVVYTTRGAKVFVPVDQTIDADQAERLLTAASARAASSSLDGSAWQGATTLSPSDQLRHALLVPRLVAPHPNMSVSALTAAQGLGSVVLGREWRYASSRDGGMPRLRDVDDKWSWEWRLVAAVADFIGGRGLGPLKKVHGAATDPHQSAAATAVLAAAMVEEDDPQGAYAITSELLKSDQLGLVDHGWIRLHYARAQFQLGSPTQGIRKTVFGVMNLRSQSPSDVTAAAISGAAASLLFTVADWDEFDFGQAVSAGDTAATWWRQQVVAQGLGKQADESFKAWAHDSTRTHSIESTWDEFRAVSLMTGFLGDHSGWCGAMARLARYVLTSEDLAQEPRQVENALTVLVSAGADKNVAMASGWLLAAGRADEVKKALDRRHPTRATVTSLQADVSLMTEAGDVMDPELARDVAGWVRAIMQDPSGLPQRLHARFDIQSTMLKLLSGVLPAMPIEDHPALLSWLLDLDLETPGLSSRPLAKLVSAIDSESWAQDAIDRAMIRAESAADPLKFALLRRAARARGAAQKELAEEARSGKADAMWALGDVTQLPLDLVQALHALARDGVSRLATGERADWGDIDTLDVLVLLNVNHPETADWQTLLDYLRNAHGNSDLKSGLSRLAHNLDRVPPAMSAELDVISERLLSLPEPEHQTLFHRDFRAAARHLHAAIGQRLDEDEGWSRMSMLLSGSTEDRMSAALLCAEPSALRDGVLATLTRDGDVFLRATAASVAAHRACRGDDFAQRLITGLIDDPSNGVAQAVAQQVRTHPSSEMLGLLSNWSNHISGSVRTDLDRARRALAGR